MPVELKIFHDNAPGMLEELAVIAGRLSTPAVSKVTDTTNIQEAAPAAPEPTAEPEKPRGRGRPKKVDETPAATAEPEAEQVVEETPETVAQDAADEAKPAGAPATKDDVRDALMEYANKYGMDAAQQDGPSIMGFARMSAIEPKTAEVFQQVVDKLKAATRDNPHKRAIEVAAADVTS